MTTQSLPEKILWTLHEHGSMKRSELRRRAGLRLHELMPILEDLGRMAGSGYQEIPYR